MSTVHQHRRLSLLLNPLSLLGLGIFIIATSIGLSMMIADFFRPEINPYTGIFTYLVLPAVAGLGAILAAVGMVLSHYARKRSPDWTPITLPRLDLNKRSHRIALIAAFLAALVSINLIALTAYRSVNFSDSPKFCGLACHGVMLPEFTTYQNSPHARVDCVQCHVGPGVSGFVRSKISGSYQLYSVVFKKYHKPIETPVENLRPAQETCERCHWPSKFFGAQQKTFTHFLSEEKNPAWQIQMLLKIGGGNPEEGGASGIHWHMNIKNKIDYIASDKKREIIPWVRSTDPTGKSVEYVSTENTLTPEELSKKEVRRMDCVDCHNRPSHIFMSPSDSVDRALASGQLDPSLPFLKREAVRILSQSYPSTKEALEKIPEEVTAFYQKEYPELYRQKGAAVLQATQVLKSVYARSEFPEMKTDWRSHLNHLGHWQSDGCFRCHDGLHKSREGKVITNDCNACHTILAQGTPSKGNKVSLQAQSFRHPVDIGVDVTTMKCTACHGTESNQ